MVNDVVGIVVGWLLSCKVGKLKGFKVVRLTALGFWLTAVVFCLQVLGFLW